MTIRIPQNIIIESKYTIGNEFILLSSYQVYQGYYYEINGKYFVGKEFTPDAPELQKIISPKSNSLLKIASSFIFGKISGININQKNTPTSVIYQPTQEDYDKGYSIRYFYKKCEVKLSYPSFFTPFLSLYANITFSKPNHRSIIKYLIGE